MHFTAVLLFKGKFPSVSDILGCTLITVFLLDPKHIKYNCILYERSSDLGNLIPRPAFKQPIYSVSQSQDFLDLFIHLPVWKLPLLVYRLVQHESEIKIYNNKGNSNPKR